MDVEVFGSDGGVKEYAAKLVEVAEVEKTLMIEELGFMSASWKLLGTRDALLILTDEGKSYKGALIGMIEEKACG